MEWSEGDNWSLQVELFPGLTDFKCAVVRQDGSVAAWEPGANRTVEVWYLQAVMCRVWLFHATLPPPIASVLWPFCCVYVHKCHAWRSDVNRLFGG